MQLLDAILLSAQASQEASQPTELTIGTVTKISPLEITTDDMQAPLREQVLYLTQAVVEKKIPILNHIHHVTGLGHSHTCPEGGTSTDLTGTYDTTMSLVSSGATGDQSQDIICYENGEALPIKDGFIILNRSLEQGDKVLLLRVQHGQKFVILSRVCEVK